jgi:hypothetical protein
VHRNALFLAQYTTSWNWPGSSSGVANQHAWLRSYYASVHPHAQNYIDPDLTDWPQAYYGANYPRLQQVKKRYDPHQLFSFPRPSRLKRGLPIERRSDIPLRRAASPPPPRRVCALPVSSHFTGIRT